MHSSRMRTGRSLTVCRSLPPGGCTYSREVYLVPGGVLSPGGCLTPGVSDWAVSDPGGVCLRHPPVNRMTDRCKNITLATTSQIVLSDTRIPAWFKKKHQTC